MLKKLFPTRSAWRSWLDVHHAEVKEIWLIYHKKHTGKKSISYEDAVQEALCFGWIDSTVKRIDDERYMQKFTPRKIRSNWSTINKNRVARLIKEGRMNQAGLEIIEKAKKDGSWDKLSDVETNLAIPDDLAHAFKKNPIAEVNFQKFAPSYRKQYLWWLSSAKRAETRKKRIKEIVQRSRQNIKPGI
jgi:uncharacterized protein YdeI (YjbR/CyaY-like superfamily)